MTVSQTALHFTSRFRSLQFLKRPFSASIRYPLAGLNNRMAATPNFCPPLNQRKIRFHHLKSGKKKHGRNHALAVSLRFFYARPFIPPFAARSSATAPTRGARSKTAPASPRLPPAAVTFFAFAGFLLVLARAARWLPASEASSQRQDDGQRFQKSYEDNKPKNEGILD